MTKNAITVIGQELIDWFENWLSDTEVNELLEIDEKTIELLDLAKDLIEINAELTKREQKTKSSLAVCANYLSHALNLDEVECEEDKASIHAKINDFLVSINEELKGDSDVLL